MSTLAYRGDAAIRNHVIARLRMLEQAGNWVARPIHWNGTAGSLVGSLLPGEDLDAWETEVGLPKWLALLVDGLWVEAPNLREGITRGIGVLEGLSPGAPLDVAGSRCLLAWLDGEHGLSAKCPPGPLADALAAVCTLHRRRVAGEAVAPAEWRRVRREALAITDTLEAESTWAMIGACVEAAAWDPAASRTVASDTLRCWIRATAAVEIERHGWTATDDDRMRALLRQLHADGKAALGDDSFVDVFQLLERRYPDEAARLKAHMARQRTQSGIQWRLAADLLEAALDVVPVAAALIPRDHLFANPARAGISISPDGEWLAWLADGGGVMNIWAAPRAKPDDARQVTHDRRRGVHGFKWTRMPGMLLFSQDCDGNENWRLFGADLATGEVRGLSPANPKVRANVHSISRVRREHVLITLNERDPRYPDLYQLDLRSGELLLLEENPGFSGYLVDDGYCVRLAGRSTADGGSELLQRDNAGRWQPWITLSPEDASSSGPTHFSADGRTLYFRDSRGRDTSALVAIDIDSGTTTVLAEDPRADVGGTLNDPIDYRPLACGVSYERHRLHVLDESIRADVEFLDGQAIGEWHLGSRTEDDRLWLVSASSDVRSSAAYLYDRTAQTLEKLFDLRPQLAGARLARMQSTTIEARDGLKLVSYLTLPVDADNGAPLRARRPLPMVLLVHGGPWARDGFGYNSMHQWLANRGYAVLSVNFRGSTGFGKAFITAAEGEWGRRMDEDLEDAVEWAIARGIADPARLAIFGGSYGGYAVLSALTRYPHRYVCGIDVVGPSNLETLLASIPAYWESARRMQYRAIGNPETEAGRALLRERSPLHRAAAIRSPLLIAQGGNDPRVRQAESEQMVAALRANGIAVEYALYPDEGHGFVREPNRMSFNALVEDFLARHLGGRAEPAPAGGFPGSTLQWVSGTVDPGLAPPQMLPSRIGEGSVRQTGDAAHAIIAPR